MSNRQRSLLTIFLVLAAFFLCFGITAGAYYLLVPTTLSSTSATPLPPLIESEGNASLSEQGLLITGITANGPAAQAGLQRGYIILRIADTSVDTPSALNEHLQAQAGKRVDLQLLVGNEVRPFSVDLATTDPFLGVQLLGNNNEASPSQPPLPPNIPDTPIFIGPPRIESILPNTPAAAASLQADDIITAVDGHALLSAEELITRIATYAPGDTITLTIRRAQETLTLTATLTTNPNDESRPFLGVNLTPSS